MTSPNDAEVRVTRAGARERPGGHKKRALLSPPLGKRSFVRIDDVLMGSPVIEQLTDAESVRGSGF